MSDASVAQHTVQPNTTRIYTLTVEDDNGCISTDQVTVTVNESPDASIMATVPCEGQSMIIQTTPFGGDGGYIFSWIGPNGFTSSAESPIINNFANRE